MTLVSITFSGFLAVDVVSIAGFVMEKQEGNFTVLLCGNWYEYDTIV